ncbi:hypothetical protein C4D60_Mb01t32270 [Musa balbisiana]|uniref:Uncharacterized protein n=1 Tax=Musa balbisiana TaxID=52838 RepID=A0A4S8JSB2_MUSBA|nr:hypothetical protein C4D60_Mb01t32270 [Musa balbisiana]
MAAASSSFAVAVASRPAVATTATSSFLYRRTKKLRALILHLLEFESQVQVTLRRLGNVALPFPSPTRGDIIEATRCCLFW